ncbi:MAG: glycine dehydrogenase subunit 1 [Candidatus Bathyarchaeota archaeon BA1]|nr:MAG: glycine dehydrogenase subunit 1 [Candidatus Bathyarchaeota archaeon BA1]
MAKSLLHPYIPNSAPEIKREIMRHIGIESIEELYVDLPQKFRLRGRLNLPSPMSEQEVRRHVENLLSENKTFWDMPTFLGAGCWPHYVPAVVEAIVQRTELLTSYTPYQAEISQGMLQALFEYQSMVCEIAGMDVANCSMYDWASALGEAVRMAARLTHRTRAIVPRIIHPERALTLQTYVEPIGLRVESIDYNLETGQLDMEDLKARISEDTGSSLLALIPSHLAY